MAIEVRIPTILRSYTGVRESRRRIWATRSPICSPILTPVTRACVTA